VFGASIAIRDIFEERIQDFHVRVALYRKALARAGVRCVFAVVYYVHPALVAAARSLGIKVVDIQHGLFGVGYDGILQRRDIFVPDGILLFGSHWGAPIEAAPHIQLRVLGAPHLREPVLQVEQGAREPYLLFLSQPMIRKQLLDFAIALARLDGAPPILFRLHPGDDIAKASAMIEAAGLPPGRLAISHGGGGRKTLEMLARAHAQIGAFSTALVEGLCLGTRTFVADTPGWSMLKAFIDSGEIELAGTPEQLLEKLKAGRPEASRPALIDTIFAAANPAAVTEMLEALGCA
jgi:hypothetical protein